MTSAEYVIAWANRTTEVLGWIDMFCNSVEAWHLAPHKAAKDACAAGAMYCWFNILMELDPC